MKSLTSQGFSSLTRFELDQSAGLARPQATGAAAFALALSALAVVAALRADPDLRSAAQEGFAAGAIAVSASVTPSRRATN
jgi:hypothetical protein